jgi:hypothetical protein
VGRSGNTSKWIAALGPAVATFAVVVLLLDVVGHSGAWGWTMAATLGFIVAGRRVNRVEREARILRQREKAGRLGRKPPDSN